MKPKLILVHGKARSGKGEVAKRLCEKYGYVEVGFADYLKELTVEVFGWDSNEIWVNRTPESRKFMQLLGEIGRMIDPDFWIKKLEERLKGKYKDRNVVISDLRYENEAVWGRHNSGQLWLVLRLGAENLIEANPDHVSEHDLEKWTDWDTISINNGTIEELYKQVDDIVDYEATIKEKKEEKVEVKSDNKKNDEIRALLLQDLMEIFVNSPMDGQTLNKIAMGLDAFGWKKGRTLPRRKWK